VHRQKTNEGLLSRLLLVSFASGEREASEYVHHRALRHAAGNKS
jgi:hypothetical protein